MGHEGKNETGKRMGQTGLYLSFGRIKGSTGGGGVFSNKSEVKKAATPVRGSVSFFLVMSGLCTIGASGSNIDFKFCNRSVLYIYIYICVCMCEHRLKKF